MRTQRLWLVLTVLLVAFGALAPAASADRAFTSRFAQMARGDVTIAANTVMTCPGNAAACTQGKAGTGSSINNQDFAMAYVDADADATTFDSSTATMTLPAGATVLFAGLYWGADTSAGGSGVAAPAAASRDVVKLKPPGGSYSTVTASTLDTDVARATRYQGFADVTSQVQAGGSGSYTVGNVQAGTGTDRYGGWALVVAYRDANLAVNWVSVYDGFGSTGFGGGNAATDVTLTGFQTPASGTVSATFGMVSYEGELGYTGETTTLNGTNLTDALHPAGNYFNSSITKLGSHVTTKNPNYVNQLGFDANLMNVDGFLPSGSSSATVHLASSLDMFVPGVMTLVTDQVATAPSNATAPAISGNVQDGQTLTAGNGTWNGSGPMTYTYQWQRCDSAGNNCSNIAGATGGTYQLVTSDIGKTFRVVVTATNVVDAASSTSPASAVATPAAPANTAPPTISGTVRDGQTLTATTGSWTGTPTISYAYQWQRCDSAGSSCADVAGATSSTYALVHADFGSTMKVVVTASNAAGTAPAGSSATAVVAADPPANTALPTITGTARDGQTLTAADGTWSGTPTITFGYQWRRCDAGGNGCADIADATASTYLQTSADVGSTIRVVVTGTNAGGSANATSAQTAVVAAIPPSNTALPTISGTVRDGQTLTAANGTWAGSPTIAFGYQWRRCDGAGANCADIAAATNSTYLLTSTDYGKTIRVVVTGTNSGGNASATSAQTAAVAATAPVNSALPTITGTAQDGQTLTGSNGIWSGTPTITFGYQWRRCDSAGANCANIAGATNANYVLASADVGKTLRIVVTATNAGGSASATSDQSAVVAAIPPANSVSPSIAGTARDGQTLVGVHGTWSGSLPLSFSHRWQRCDSAGANCANIAGATNSTYLLAPADIGSTIRFVVTASNAGGTLSKASNATAVVAAIPPAVVILPALSGPAEDGGTLTASDGSWTGSPTITLTRQWQRCDAAGANCTNISGATGTTYDEGAADVGDTLRVVVTATNPSGPVSSASPASGVVAATPPVNTAPPTVTGTVIDGQTLAASAGTWTGTATIAYTYQWRRCASTGNSCVDVPGATGSTYLLGPSDVGSTMRVAVTGSNAGGAGVATSVATGSVGAIPPQVTDPPAIAGTSTDGQTLTVSTGDWSGTLGITFTYQWRRCEADGSNCVDIAGETGNTYDLDTADIGSRVRVEVTATNAGGDATVTTQSTSVVQGVPPASTGSGPTVTGIAQQGETLTADPGTWSGTDPITYTYQWRRCDADGQNCVDIPGATGSTYEPTAADVGSTIVVVVTGTNGLGSSSSQSSPTPVVTVGLPANTDRPTVTGELVPGSTLTADPGTWTGPGPITYDYQWQRCDVDGHNCVDIVGATDSTYQVSNTDAGHAIRVEVTAKNPGGSTPQTSEDTDPVPSAEEDLGDSIPGSLVSASRCQRVLAGTGFKQQRMSGVGKIRVKVAAGAYIAPKKPLRIVATAPAAKVRSVMYLLDNRPVLRPRRAPYLLKIKPKLFGKPGMHKVAFKVTPRKGRPHRMTLKITTAPCENVLSGSQWKTSGGTGLKLRVDSRKALQSAKFKIPKNMLPSRKDAGKRTIGIAQIYLARGVRKRFELRLRKGDVSATLLKAAVGAPKIVLTKTGAVVTGLPAKAGVVELTLFTRDKTSPKALLAKRRKAKIGATVRVAGKSVRLKTIIKAQRH